jgi:NADH dehydrogenase
MQRKKILILSGGYAGLAVLHKLEQRLRRSDYSIALIEESPSHTINTRFHQLAVYRNRGGFIRFPINLFTRSAGAEFIQDRFERIHFAGKSVTTSRGDHPFDILVITLGGKTNYFGVSGPRAHTVSLQTYDSAVECSCRIRDLRLRDKRGPVRKEQGRASASIRQAGKRGVLLESGEKIESDLVK